MIFNLCNNTYGDTERSNVFNQIVLAGIVKEVPQIKETTSGVHYGTLVMDVKREYRNSEGNYDFDTIAITLWRSVVDHCVSNCSKGDMVAIKGRLHCSIYQKEDGNVFYNYEVVAEKVFLLEKEK